MKKFPSIEQFRHAVRAERDQAAHENREPGRRRYIGTVKLHGTNAGVTWAPNEPLVFQSRNRILKVGDDNAGFAAHFSEPKNQGWLKLAIADIALFNDIEAGTEISVFGEWCGEGIQKGVAVSKLPKMFVIFAAHANDTWLDVSGMSCSYQDGQVYGIFHFPTFEIDVNFRMPEIAQNEMVAITERVEACCPVGHAFGVEGIGEGVVWTPADGDRESKYWFKVKGEKHSSSKVATLAAVDVEVIRRKDELVQSVVTENRLQQGLDHFLNELKLDLEMRNIGTFLRWVFNDVIKEESDTIAASGFEQKELGKPISDVAKRFFMKAMERELETLAA
jgi:hypothetical protein